MSATPGPGGRYTDDHDRFGTKRGVVHADHDPTLPARATGGLRIVSTGPRSTSIELDGVEISDHVTAIRLDMAAGRPTTATLTMRADSVYIVAGEAVIERNDEAPDADDGEPAVNLRVEGMADAPAEQIAAAMRRAGVPARIEQAPPPDPRLVAGEDAVPWWPAFAIVGLVVLAALGIAALVTGWRP